MYKVRIRTSQVPFPPKRQGDFTCFCTLCQYVIVNLNVNENHVKYVHSKTDDHPPRVRQYTVRELSYRKHKNWKKKSLKINVKRHSTSPRMTFEQRVRAIGMLTAGLSARDVAWHF